MNRIVVVLFSLVFFSANAFAAEAMPFLKAFAKNVETLSADFSQTLEDANGRQLQHQTGTVKMKKPGKFNWFYQQPYEQKIVADGEQLWFYDVELEEVTVKPLDEALGAAPISLLTTDKPLEDEFNITDLGLQGEFYMLQLESKIKDTDYGYALIAFNKDGGLEIMQLKDPLGQVTSIEFENVKVNKKISKKTFKFKVPKGVDITGQ